MSRPTEHKAKKRRLDTDGDREVDTFKPAIRFKPTEPREWTVSVAVPTSIITDFTTREQRTTYAGRVARALAVFSIDEIVIFDDAPIDSRTSADKIDPAGYTGETHPAHFLAHILEYLEAPPFMRKTLFPLHPNLKSQGLLPSLDMPPHPHKDEWLPYREGLTMDGKTKSGNGTLVEIGMREPITIIKPVPPLAPRTRVTIHISDDGQSHTVSRETPRTEAGYFWGYTVRRCDSLSEVFTESTFEDGYDLSIGTSERGVPLSRAFPNPGTADFKHLLIVFGGPRGLEYAAMNDPELREKTAEGGRIKELFDHWVNVLPNQGSRTIRTDEAMMIALTGLRRLWQSN